MYLLFIYLVNMMKLLVVACCVVLSISQIQALPTNGNKVEIEFSKGSNIYLTRDAGNVQENEAQNIEEALFSYTRLLNGVNQQSEIQQPLLQEDLYDNLAKEQTSALCPDPSCDCEDTKLANFQGTRRDTGELCTLISVAYCQGVCPSSHRYYAVVDGPGANPTETEKRECCLSRGTKIASIYIVCQKKNGDYYSYSEDYTVPTSCACSSSSPCNSR